MKRFDRQTENPAQYIERSNAELWTKREIKRLSLLALLVLLACSLIGCESRDAIEDRAYVKYLHVQEMSQTGTYRYACELSYVGAEASDYVVDDTVEYETAEGIQAVDAAFYEETGTQLDYSHLQGIYLNGTLFAPEQAQAVLTDIWEETQAVLSTSLYEEGVEIGAQPEIPLGEWLKEAVE